jgi:hypothetical protein
VGDLICVRTFTVRNQAELARMNLEAAGIEAHISGDDAGGMAPHFALMTGGIKVMVLTLDLSKAVEILKRGEGEETETSKNETTPKSGGFLTKFRKWIRGE